MRTAQCPGMPEINQTGAWDIGMEVDGPMVWHPGLKKSFVGRRQPIWPVQSMVPRHACQPEDSVQPMELNPP